MKMRTEKRELDKIYKRRNRYEIPDYQRQEVWELDQKRKLIDSILRGWKIPKFYFVQNSEDSSSFDVVDGQQRLAAIFEFLDGDLALSPEMAKEFGGETYASLDPDVSDKIDDFEIDYDEISDATEDELVEFFQRLQSGKQINSTERLNAVPGKLKAFVKELAGHNFFAKKVAFSDKRYAYFDVVAKAAAVEIDGVDTSLRFDEMRTLFENNRAFSDKSSRAVRLRGAIDFLDKATSEGSKTYRNRTVTQSIINVVVTLDLANLMKGQEKKFSEFAHDFVSRLASEVEKGHDATDTDLISFQRSINANVKSGAQVRQRALMRKVFEWNPELLDAAGDQALALAGYDSELVLVSQRIQQLAHDINNVHAAKFGKNLIKPTNKTIQALSGMAKPAKTQTDFMNLVDQLYFTFWEGLPSDYDKPATFKDIRTLRTDFDHDVDHGGDKSFATKKKSAAETFERYSGVKSPELAGPERFTLAQLKILRAVEVELKQIAAKQA